MAVKEVKKKVLLDIFAAPSALVPLAVGLSSLLVSWAMDGNPVFSMLGLAGVLGGVGVMASRLIFGLENITQRAHSTLADQRRREHEAKLDALDDRLKEDQDPRTEDALRHLRHIINSFQTDSAKGKVSGAGVQILQQVDDLFQACVSQLEHCYDLWVASHGSSRGGRERMLAERESIIDDIGETIDHLESTLSDLRSLRRKRSDVDLDQMRAELEDTMKAAQRAEERLADLDRQLPLEREQRSDTE